jgi:hypothetical protein
MYRNPTAVVTIISGISLILIHYCNRVDSFSHQWKDNRLCGYGINAVRCFELQFDTRLKWTQDMNCQCAPGSHQRRKRIKTAGHRNEIILPHFMQCKIIGLQAQRYESEERKEDTSFDFSSKIGWEEYYQRGLNLDSVNNHDGSWEITTEWHTSIPLETISSYCWNSVNNLDEINTNNDKSFNVKKSILMIGCGTSRLAEVLMAEMPHDCNGMNDLHITLLDSSRTCIDALQRRYENYNNINCICGDAIELTRTLLRPHQPISAEMPQRFDTIIDKGLMDVLFCSDDWTTSVRKLFIEATKVLLESGGTYILVSYQLSKATKDFLTEIADGLGFSWEFDCPGSTKRVAISVASRKS